jgi:hypothetical protein
MYNVKATPEIIIIKDKFKISYRVAIDSITSSGISKAHNHITSGMSKLLLQNKPNPQKTTPIWM